MKTSRSRMPRTAALLLVGSLVVAACGDDDTDAATGSAEETTETDSTTTAPEGESAAAGNAAACAEQPEWDELVAAAQEEGNVVVSGIGDPEMRVELPAAFEEDTGVSMTYIGGRTSELLTKIEQERAAGIYSHDVYLSGPDSLYTAMMPEGFVQPLKPFLFESNLDPEVWDFADVEGVPFQDPDGEYVLRVSNSVAASVVVNTDEVDVSELTTWEDLLDAQWQGEIVAKDPRGFGSGRPLVAMLRTELGDDYVEDLWVGQEVTNLEDDAALIDEVARGRYPIGLGLQTSDVDAAIADGLPVESIALEGAPQLLSANNGLMAIADQPANPSAAALFANWIACPEGHEVWNRLQVTGPTRADVEIDLPDWQLLGPDEEGFDTYEYDFVLTTRDEATDYMNELIGEQ